MSTGPTQYRGWRLPGGYSPVPGGWGGGERRGPSQLAQQAWLLQERARLQEQAQIRSAAREQEAELEERKRQEESKLWRLDFTPQARQAIAKEINLRERLTSSEDFTQDQIDRGVADSYARQRKIRPTHILRDPSDIYPEGRGLGTSWKTEDGLIMRRGADGQEELIQRFDQSREGMEMRMQLEKEKEMREDKKMLIKEPLQWTDNLGRKMSRQRTSEEVRTAMEQLYPETSPYAPEIMAAPEISIQEMQQRYGAMAPAAQPEVTGPWFTPQQQKIIEPLWEEALGEGLTLEEIDRDLPPPLNYVQAFLRHTRDKYKSFSKIPADRRDAYLMAYGMMRAYLEEIGKVGGR